MNARDDKSPILGFTHIDDLREAIGRLDLAKWLDKVIACMGPASFGEWTDIGPMQTPDGTPVEVVHAAMLRTGWVLFIEAACRPRTRHR